MARLLWRVLKASGMWVEHWLQQDVETEFHNTKLIIRMESKRIRDGWSHWKVYVHSPNVTFTKVLSLRSSWGTTTDDFRLMFFSVHWDSLPLQPALVDQSLSLPSYPVSGYSKFSPISVIFQAWLSGALHSPAKLQYLRDQQLLRVWFPSGFLFQGERMQCIMQ